MTEPRRIQRKRTKGWNMPENTVYVGRGSDYGNPFKIPEVVNTPEEAVYNYECLLQGWVIPYSDPTKGIVSGFDPVTQMMLIRKIKDKLKGKNLACWCPLDRPCHADVLLRIANG